jgi:hypothetical protein
MQTSNGTVEFTNMFGYYSGMGVIVTILTT